MYTLRNSNVLNLNKSGDINRTFQYYEQLKSNFMDFPPNPLKTNRLKSLDPGIKRLTQKLTSMESSKKLAENKANELEGQVFELSSQLRKMHSINRKLLQDKFDESPGEMNFVVQELIVTDLKKDLKEAQLEIQKFKLELDKAKSKINLLSIEKQKSENKLKQYRKIVAENIEAQKLAGLNDSSLSLLEAKSSRGLKTGYLTSRHNIHENLTRNHPISHKLFYQELTDINRYKTLNELLSWICKTSKSLLNCKKSSIYIVNPALQYIYINSLDSSQNINRLQLGHLWGVIHSGIYTDMEEPRFAQISDIKHGDRNSEHIIDTIYMQKEVGLIIQCQESKKGLFDLEDEFILKSLLVISNILIKNYMNAVKQDKLQNQLKEVTQLISSLNRTRDYLQIMNVIEMNFPGFFGYEAAKLVLIDQEKKEFYSYNNNERIQYPLSMGLTGETLESGTMRIYEHIKRKLNFQPDMDCITSSIDLDSCVMSCLHGASGTVGILHLYNKKERSVSPHDIEIIGNISLAVGSIISIIGELQNSINLTIQFKDSCANINQTLIS